MVFAGLARTIEVFRGREASDPRHQPLCAAIACVLDDWAKHWGDDPAMKSFLNRPWRKLFHEIDEYVMPLYCLIGCLEKRKHQRKDIVLIELGSGKGYMVSPAIVPWFMAGQFTALIRLAGYASQLAKRACTSSPAQYPLHLHA
jgi:hypothetical protein